MKNNKNKRRLVWLLTGRGFGSEINNMLYAINYSIQNNYELINGSYFWNFKHEFGWDDYFESMNNEFNKSSLVAFLKIVDRFISISTLVSFNNRNLGFFEFKKLNQEYSILKLVIFFLLKKIILLSNSKNEKSIFESFEDVRFYNLMEVDKNKNNFLLNINAILLDIWRIKPHVYEEIKKNSSKLKNEYAVFHIRRGDKIKSGEDGFYDVDEYMNRFLNLNSELKTIFIMGDDYSAYLDLKTRYKNFNFLTLMNNNDSGHDQKEFNKSSKVQKKTNAINLLTEIEIARKSKVFIGSQKSNLFRLVEYFKLDSCYDVSVGECEFII